MNDEEYKFKNAELHETILEFPPGAEPGIEDIVRALRERGLLPPGAELAPSTFTTWHPLDHRFGGFRCRHLAGGLLLHIKVAVRFGWGTTFSRRVLCPIGRHVYVRFHAKDGTAFTRCHRCGKVK